MVYFNLKQKCFERIVSTALQRVISQKITHFEISLTAIYRFFYYLSIFFRVALFRITSDWTVLNNTLQTGFSVYAMDSQNVMNSSLRNA